MPKWEKNFLEFAKEGELQNKSLYDIGGENFQNFEKDLICKNKKQVDILVRS